jgi:hypothetical protein
MSRHFPHIERAYAATLWLYPASFRESYSDAMLQSLHDALADSSLPRPALLRTLLKDLIQSLIKENLAMLRETISRPTLLYNALVLMALCTAICLGFVVIEQQALRQSANDPQLGIATDLAIRLARGISPAVAVPNDKTDMDLSLSPFVIAYDEQGKVLASSAQLNGAVPQLPQGVLDYMRTHREDRITWAPQRYVRIASVILHVSGPQGGFVVAGPNLREIEARKDLLMQLAVLVWLGLIGIIFVGTFLFGWLTRTPKPAAA